MPTLTAKTNGHTKIQVPDAVGKLAQDLADRLEVLAGEIEKVDRKRDKLTNEQAKITAALLALQI